MIGGRNRWRLILIGFGMSLAVVLTLYKFEWTGFGQGDSVSTTINKKDADGNIVETITTTTEPGKTLWDWLSLLGVPLTLAILGYILQQQERSRTNNEAKEEILQNYFDRLSTLLVDKNILAIAAKVYPPPEKQGDDQPKATIPPEEEELFDSAVDVIRARTLSILRRFEGDGERKGVVIRFLIEADVISKAKLSLREADLSGADLIEAKLSGAHLSRAKLIEADLSGAHLNDADLNDAKLSGAKLSAAELSGARLFSADLRGASLKYADLSGAHLILAHLNNADLSAANLNNADLSGAHLNNADLSGANLNDAKLRGAKLSGANISRADLRGANLRGANLEGANIKSIEWNDETQWPAPTEVANAKNIPEALKQQLGLTDTTEPKAPNP